MTPALSTTLATILLVAALTNGCVPLGPRSGKEEIVAKRINPGGEVAEQIIGVPTEHHWMMLIAPDGPEFNTVLSETWRFYLIGANGERESLGFLRQRGGNVMPWNLIAPVAHTNLWIGVIGTGSPKRVEQRYFDYRVICFTPRGIISEKMLDPPEYGTFQFDSESHTLTYKMKDKSQSYDPLGNDDLH
jgi:hypothetical protein